MRFSPFMLLPFLAANALKHSRADNLNEIAESGPSPSGPGHKRDSGPSPSGPGHKRFAKSGPSPNGPGHKRESGPSSSGPGHKRDIEDVE